MLHVKREIIPIMRKFAVTVFCGSSPGVDPGYMESARELGAGLAQHGMSLVFGGGNVGLMGVVAGAALSAGAHVTGIIPDFLRQREVEFPGLSELIVTDSMHTRKRRLFALADVFVVLPGGLGTFDETIEILTWRQLATPVPPIEILARFSQIKPQRQKDRDAARTPLTTKPIQTIRDRAVSYSGLRQVI